MSGVVLIVGAFKSVFVSDVPSASSYHQLNLLEAEINLLLEREVFKLNILSLIISSAAILTKNLPANSSPSSFSFLKMLKTKLGFNVGPSIIPSSPFSESSGLLANIASS